jgi:hypothetical protein
VAASGLLILLLPPLQRPAQASSPAAWAGLDTQVRATCRAASTLSAVVEPGDRLDLPGDRLSLLLLEGRHRQPHLRGQKGLELCVYERANGVARVLEADGLLRSLAPPAPRSAPPDQPPAHPPARP